MRKEYSRIKLQKEDPKYFKTIFKGRRVDEELDLAIALAHSRGYTRASFLSLVKKLWGETKDVIKEQEHEEWMKQIRL